MYHPVMPSYGIVIVISIMPAVSPSILFAKTGTTTCTFHIITSMAVNNTAALKVCNTVIMIQTDTIRTGTMTRTDTMMTMITVKNAGIKAMTTATATTSMSATIGMISMESTTKTIEGVAKSMIDAGQYSG
jgi:hypothetical protein